MRMKRRAGFVEARRAIAQFLRYPYRQFLEQVGPDDVPSQIHVYPKRGKAWRMGEDGRPDWTHAFALYISRQVDHLPKVHELYVSEWDMHEAMRWLARQHPREHQVVVAHCLDGKSLDADMDVDLGLSRATAYRLYNRGLELLYLKLTMEYAQTQPSYDQTRLVLCAV